MPVVAGLHPPADRLFVGSLIAVVAVDAVVMHRRQRVRDACGRFEVHIRDPHRQTILRGDAIKALHRIPLRAACAHTIDDGIEPWIEIGMGGHGQVSFGGEAREMRGGRKGCGAGTPPAGVFWEQRRGRRIAICGRLDYVKGMTKRTILIHPDPRLKAIAAAVEDSGDDLRALAEDMLETMYHAPGIGLAAPQIGIGQRLIVMDCVKEEGEAPRPLAMLNPRVIAASDETSVYEEGCLSIPDQYADVTRPAEVEVAWMDVDGSAKSEVFTGLWATCVQHEIDHLDGKLFIDYLKPLKRQMITRKMQKLKRELARP